VALVSLAVRVLMLSWEYPPLVVGGLGRHVAALSRELAAAGHEVHVVTRGEQERPASEVIGGVHVHRAAADPIAIDFSTESLLAWAAASEHALVRAALPVVAHAGFDIVHAHDWLVAQSAATMTAATGAPMIATIHATESGRNQGHLTNPLNRAIHSIERWLCHSADAVIACSPSMRIEVEALFGVAEVAVVPNGIDADRWQLSATQRRAARRRYAADGPTVAFAGRLVYEKGVQTLLEAVRPLRRRYPGLRAAIAGTGPYEDELRARAKQLRLGSAVEWLGFAPDQEVVERFAVADAIVVPSLYEPFGIVALEAAASGTPLVASDTGGLRDAIASGLAEAHFQPGDATGLIAGLDHVLADPAAARRRARRAASRVVHEYSWAAVADRTAEIYRLARAGRSSR
jgi:glycogen(starch) synthase